MNKIQIKYRNNQSVTESTVTVTAGEKVKSYTVKPGVVPDITKDFPEVSPTEIAAAVTKAIKSHTFRAATKARRQAENPRSRPQEQGAVLEALPRSWRDMM